ncbi:MAG: nuclear transport factor 2 family protein [Betaproteobacteria bacterium]
MNDTTEKDRVIETVNRLFINTDKRDWPEVKALFASRVLFDMTSLAGGQPAIITPQEIVDGWDKGLKALTAIHHQTGNFLVDIKGDETTLFCYGVAWHYLPNKTNRNTRTFVGSYDFHLKKQDGEWKIDRFKFNLKFIDGNTDLEKG